MAAPEEMRKISDTVWEIPVNYKEGMRVPAHLCNKVQATPKGWDATVVLDI